LLEHQTDTRPARVDISRYMLFEIVTIMRLVMMQDVPEVSEGAIYRRPVREQSEKCRDPGDHSASTQDE
jgi:hypothetical protein